MIARVLLGCVALGALAFASLADEPEPPKEVKIKPALLLAGSHSGIDRESFYVVTNEDAWKDLWAKHRGNEKTQRFTESEQYAEIDFDTHYIVAVFTPGFDGCDITPRKRGEEVVIGFRPLVYCTEGRVGEDNRTEHEKAKETAVSPYVFVVLSKPVRTIVIEKDVREMKIDPPLWKEQKRFPAPKGKK
jgi:hypothetical protein